MHPCLFSCGKIESVHICGSWNYNNFLDFWVKMFAWLWPPSKKLPQIEVNCCVGPIVYVLIYGLCDMVVFLQFFPVLGPVMLDPLST